MGRRRWPRVVWVLVRTDPPHDPLGVFTSARWGMHYVEQETGRKRDWKYLNGHYWDTLKEYELIAEILDEPIEALVRA